jgi:hypothetical protein
LDEINNEYSAQRHTTPKFSSQNLEAVNKFIQEKYPKTLLERSNLHASTIGREEVKTSEK